MSIKSICSVLNEEMICLVVVPMLNKGFQITAVKCLCCLMIKNIYSGQNSYLQHTSIHEDVADDMDQTVI